jgi:hypothetical protein
MVIPESVSFIAGTALEALQGFDYQGKGFYLVEWPFLLTGDRKAIVLAFAVPPWVHIPDETEILQDGCFIRSPVVARVFFSPVSCLARIGEGAFYSSTLCRIHIPKTVDILDSECFAWCEKLSICIFEIDSRCREIRDSAFSYTAITWMRIPGTVEVIGRRCFSGSRNLRDIEFDGISRLTLLGDQAFSNTSVCEFELPITLVDVSGLSLEGINMISLADGHPLSFDGELLCNETDTMIIRAFSPSQDLIIPEKIETIGKFAFSRIGSLGGVYFERESQLKRIEEGAFSGSSVTEIALPPSIRFVHETAFEWCTRLNRRTR